VPTENPATPITIIAICCRSTDAPGRGRPNRKHDHAHESCEAAACLPLTARASSPRVSGSPMRIPPHTSLLRNGYCRREIFRQESFENCSPIPNDVILGKR
jgi:hypothetical protein